MAPSSERSSRSRSSPEDEAGPIGGVGDEELQRRAGAPRAGGDVGVVGQQPRVVALPVAHRGLARSDAVAADAAAEAPPGGGTAERGGDVGQRRGRPVEVERGALLLRAGQAAVHPAAGPEHGRRQGEHDRGAGEEFRPTSRSRS